ncbi:ATP-dependent (S)-NAD(P)H-hydrate dehydratase-like [Diadema antillarum]|uniref:ATP-dependent (S)-NAD(P)H-hydrate dehydratase-like n=1 Tax=Diadema antillarum TaxID=105358 RepID=UPI003A84F29A
MLTLQTILSQLLTRMGVGTGAAALSTAGENVITTLTDGGHIINMVRSVVPPLSYGKHKGQDGRIATIGGCREYTGAPFFSAISAFRVGCDLSHIFCTGDAAPVIKSYSPELIVHPCLDAPNAVAELGKWLPRMHSVVIGPGLGRDQGLLDTVKDIISAARELELPLVIDAVGADPDPMEPIKDVMELCRSLGHVTVCRKGENDIISDGHNVLVCCGEGCPRRCGGQGDILSGTMGVFTFWAHQACRDKEAITNEYLAAYGPTLCAAYGACLLTKRCAMRAFHKMGRGMTTTEMLPEIQPVFADLYETSK